MNSFNAYQNNERPQTSTPLKPEYHFAQNDSEEHHEENQKGTRFLGMKAVAVLNKWFEENKGYPYPDEPTTDMIAKMAGNLPSFLLLFNPFN